MESELHDEQGTTEALSKSWVPLKDYADDVLHQLVNVRPLALAYRARGDSRSTRRRTTSSSPTVYRRSCTTSSRRANSKGCCKRPKADDGFSAPHQTGFRKCNKHPIRDHVYEMVHFSMSGIPSSPSCIPSGKSPMISFGGLPHSCILVIKSVTSACRLASRSLAAGSDLVEARFSSTSHCGSSKTATTEAMILD